MIHGTNTAPVGTAMPAQPMQNALAARAQPGAPMPGQPMPGQPMQPVGTAMPAQPGFRMGMPVQAQPIMARPGLPPQGTAMPAQPMQPWQQPQQPQNALMQRARGFV